MITLTFREWQLEADKVETRRAYTSVAKGNADTCDCSMCKNFVEYREHIFPDEVKWLFSKLGIDYSKDSEASYFFKDKEGLHHYGGWFHFKGSFTGKSCAIPQNGGGYNMELVPINENFSIGFWNNSALNFFDDGEGLVQVEFWAIAPWVIEKDLEPKE